MDDHVNKPDDFMDSWSRLSPIERECLQHIEHDGNLVDTELQKERDAALEKLWSTFQETAASLAHLYKEHPTCDCCDRCNSNRRNHDRNWQPFQGAANKVTTLYRDGSDSLRAGLEYGYKAGYKKRTKELANWARKKKRTIRREDILLNLCGRSPPRRRNHEISGRTISPNRELCANENTNTANLSDLDFLMESAARADSRKRHAADHFNFFDTTSHNKRGKFS